MHVLVTGGTGFVGGWSAKAVADAGHRVRFLVRDPARLATSVGRLGVDISDFAVGDITDPASVATALTGCDAVVHCAAVVDTDPKRAEEMIETNMRGAENVVGQAVELGLDPIVYVSSVTAIFDRGLPRFHADLPVVGGADGYGRAKAGVERYVRGLQDAGAPVATSYPGMVLGPPVGNQFGEAAEGIEGVVRMGLIPGRDAAWLMVDARDLAALHAALLVPGQGPRRYLAGHHHLDVQQISELVGEATGRRLRVLPVPGAALRLVGRVADRLRPVMPAVADQLTEAGMQYYTEFPASDDSPSERDLGIGYRPAEETIADTVAGLRAVGRL